MFIEYITRLTSLDRSLAAAIAIIMVATAVLVFLSLYAGVTSVVERRIAGRIQSRIGPNYVFFRGLLQFLADGIKIIQKEDIIPEGADRVLFRAAPYVVFMGMVGTWVVVPFGDGLIPADLNIGILYLFAIGSFNVIGLLMAGWGSNNKWSLIGGIRAAAQMVSYEIPSGMSALVIVILAGSLSIQHIIRAQGALPDQWFIADNPFALFAFFIMFISMLAEGNRVPFDIPEAESELVSGYNTEYSGMRFLVFYFAEWANIYVISAVIATLFLGGWNSPFHLEASLPWGSLELSGVLIFLVKALFITFLVIWVRWTLPRLRVDQLMSLCWKYLIPIAFVNVIGVLLWVLYFPDGLRQARWAILGLGALIMAIFVYRVVVLNLVKMKAKIDFNWLQ